MKHNVIKPLMVGSTLVFGIASARAQSLLGDAANYSVIVDPYVQTFAMGGGSTIMGNVGIALPNNGNAPQVSLAGGVINGNIQFAGTYNQGNQQNNNPPNFGGTVTGGYSQNVSEVTAVWSIVSSLSSTFSSFGGSSLTINPSSLGVGGVQTVNATSGSYDSAEKAYVFNVTSMTLNSGNTLVINGAAGQNVVINVNDQNGEFNGGIKLTGGLTADNVIINITSSGEFQNATGGAAQNVTYIDEYSQDINIENPIDGHFFGGGGNGNFQITSGGEVINVVAAPEAAAWIWGMLAMMPVGGSLWRMIRQRSIGSNSRD